MKLRNAACADGGIHRASGDKLRIGTHASALAQSVRCVNIEGTVVTGQAREARLPLTLPDGYNDMGPAARIRALGNPDNHTADVRSFLFATSSRNILSQCPESLRSVAPGIDCYAAFCDRLSLSGPYFPPPPPPTHTPSRCYSSAVVGFWPRRDFLALSCAPQESLPSTWNPARLVWLFDTRHSLRVETLDRFKR